MHEILDGLSHSAFVLDLGCARGSFDASSTRATVVRLDRVVESVPGEHIVQGDAARLPSRREHGSYHRESQSRTLRRPASLSMRNWACDSPRRRTVRIGSGRIQSHRQTVPVACGRRWTRKSIRCARASHPHDRGRDRSAPRGDAGPLFIPLVSEPPQCSAATAAPPLALRRRPRVVPLLYTWISRRIDRLLHLRTSVYGWAFYFGSIAADIDTATSSNVCIRCGSGVGQTLCTAGDTSGAAGAGCGCTRARVVGRRTRSMQNEVSHPSWRAAGLGSIRPAGAWERPLGVEYKKPVSEQRGAQPALESRQ